MASFKIHEDVSLVPRTKYCKVQKENKENIVNKSKIPKKITLAAKRPALQCFNNGVRQDSKRIKIGNKENVPPPQDRMYTKKEEKPKPEIDSDLLKIVTACSENIESKNDVILPLSEPLTSTKVYSMEIMKYYKEIEDKSLPKPNYMDKQPHLSWNMRSILVDWLVCVAEEYSMSDETLYLSVNYLDRFLSQISVVREKLQLVGSSAMLIAGKMEEIFPPMPKEWSYLTGDSFTTRQIIKMEQLIIKILEYKLKPVTSYNFLKHFCADNGIDDTTMNLAQYITELMMLEGKEFLKFKPSEIAAASILHARFNLMKHNIWPEEMEKSSGYTVHHLSPIVEAQELTLKDSPSKKQQAIREKYKSPKFGRVALIKPRCVKLIFPDSEGKEESLHTHGSEETPLDNAKVL
ncbi:hypothetical protein WA026_023595 [Henosepilachna vigintioctopunctata]|uniref:Cyclin A n=1 Tax=Henosepilachna vigintioctopunctata TaxID=420089 RepID=A0AAW1UYX4_9CUCU